MGFDRTPRVVAACGLLLTQNVVEALLLHLSRKPDQPKYVAAGAVLVMQLVKIKLSVLLLIAQGYSPKSILSYFKSLTFYEGYVQYSIPSLLYTVQNNLRFLALSYITPSTYQMLLQLKILSTAFFSILFLGRKIHRIQWIALVLLMAGLSIAELQSSRSSSAVEQSDHLVGVAAVLGVAVCSGLAGAWTEKVTKKRMDVSIFLINIQLASFSVLESTVLLLFTQGPSFFTVEIWKGYSALTWAAIYLGATGGTLVGLVVRYTSSIAKTYVVSFAIFVNAAIEATFFSGLVISSEFWFSVVIVFCSVLLFNDPLTNDDEKKQSLLHDDEKKQAHLNMDSVQGVVHRLTFELTWSSFRDRLKKPEKLSA